MASNRAVALALATLHEAYPTRAVTAQTAEVWMTLFAAVADDQLLAGCRRLAVEDGRQFFPSPGEIMAIVAPAPVVNSDDLLARIARLGSYNPHSGWIYPRIEVVRSALGDAVADAYVEAGASRCFADNDRDGGSISRDIARRQFATHITRTAKTYPDGILLAPNVPQKSLPSETK